MRIAASALRADSDCIRFAYRSRIATMWYFPILYQLVRLCFFVLGLYVIGRATPALTTPLSISCPSVSLLEVTVRINFNVNGNSSQAFPIARSIHAGSGMLAGSIHVC